MVNIMFGFFKKKVKKEKCNHKWHHLQDTYIWDGVDNNDAHYIFCSKCKAQKIVFEAEWERIKKVKDIMDAETPQYKFVLKIINSRTGKDNLVIVKGSDIKKIDKSTVVVDEVEMAFGVFEYVAEINAYII